MHIKVYYGEYTLRHWLHLLLTKDIVLPSYQRYLSWEQWQVANFAQNLKNNKFIPPVIIAACHKKDEKGNITTQNLIIDGQQRLTAILLAATGLFPNSKTKEFFIDDIDEKKGGAKLLWRYDKLLDSNEGVSLQSIIEHFSKDEKYFKTRILLSDDILSKATLGFSYIVPSAGDVHDFKKQQQYFSTLFRDINQQGTKLTKQESRRSLYFLDETLEEWFNPSFASQIKNTSTNQSMDFVRYISILTEYHKRLLANPKVQISDILPSEKKFPWEEYYSDYIYSVTEIDSGKEYEAGKNPTEIFGRFEDIFEKRDYTSHIKSLEYFAKKIGIITYFESIIDMDIYYFGLIYYILFQKESIDKDKISELKLKLQSAIDKIKKDDNHVKSPSAKTYLGARINKSLIIYKKYLYKNDE